MKGANAVPVWQRSTWVAKDSGDYLVEEQSEEVLQELLRFFAN